MDGDDAEVARETIQVWWSRVEDKKREAGMSERYTGKRDDLGSAVDEALDCAQEHPLVPASIAEQIRNILHELKGQLDLLVNGPKKQPAVHTDDTEEEDHRVGFEQIEIALHEAIVNGYMHGAWSDPCETVSVRAEISAFHQMNRAPDADEDGISPSALLQAGFHRRIRLMVVVEDPGEGFDPDLVEDPTAAENIGKGTGRGNLMMNAFMHVSRNEVGNIVHLEQNWPEGGKQKQRSVVEPSGML